MHLNRHELIGRVGSEPSIKTTFNGTKQVKLSIATNHVYFKEEEKVEQTDWHTVVFYGKLADICESYVKKGSLVYISGRHTMTKVGKEAGKTPTLYSEIAADKLIMLSSKNDTTTETKPDKLPF